LGVAVGRFDAELHLAKSADPKPGFYKIAIKGRALQLALLNVKAPEVEPSQIVVNR
jgi:hypothetical protein